MTGDAADFDAILAESRRLRRCAECSADLLHGTVPSSAFCSDRCRCRFRDRRRYAADPDAARARARRYYAEHREEILEKAAARRGKMRPPERTTCEECGALLEGRQRVTCGARRCREARYRRTNPESYAQREAAKVERRREARRRKREGEG